MVTTISAFTSAQDFFNKRRDENGVYCVSTLVGDDVIIAIQGNKSDGDYQIYLFTPDAETGKLKRDWWASCASLPALIGLYSEYVRNYKAGRGMASDFDLI